MTDDSNENGEGVALYQQFRPSEDTDNDGLTDDWELRYLGSTGITDGHADSDSDGHTDLQEFRTGTDPTNTLSKLSLNSITLDGSNVLIGWQTVGGRTNVVQAASSVTGVFTDLSLPLVIPGNGTALASYLDQGGDTNSPARFYRIRTAP